MNLQLAYQTVHLFSDYELGNPFVFFDSLLLCSIHAIQMQVVMYRGPRPPLDGLFYPSDPQTNQVPQ